MPYIISVLILIIIGVGFTLFKTAPSAEFTEVVETISLNETEVAIETGEANDPPTDRSSTNNTRYRDGTYVEQTSYRTPEGNYQMSVTFTIEKDLIIDSSIAFNDQGAESNYSKSFVASYKQEVLQRNLEEVSLSRVGGASLTTKAFNSVLQSVKSQASS